MSSGPPGLPEPARAPAPVARLQGVGLRYKKTTALAAVSLEVPAGCMAGLIGPA